MTEKIISSHLKRHLNLATKISALTYVWGDKDEKVGSLRKRRLVRITIVLQIVYLICVIFGIWVKDVPTRDKCVSMYLLLPHFTVVALQWEWEPNPECVQLLNRICRGNSSGSSNLINILIS